MEKFKVVCIKDEIKAWTTPPTLFDQLVKGDIYTVVKVITSDALTGKPKQYYNLAGMSTRTYYASTMFRPVQDIGDSVENHIQEKPTSKS